MDKDEIIERIELKKRILSEQKLLYSQTTDELSRENQLHFRMSKALKKQNLNIKRKTKRYLDDCVQRAYYEAELEYSHEILTQVSDTTEYVRRLNDSHFFDDDCGVGKRDRRSEFVSREVDAISSRLSPMPSSIPEHKERGHQREHQVLPSSPLLSLTPSSQSQTKLSRHFFLLSRLKNKTDS
jgi:hypothetical protein